MGACQTRQMAIAQGSPDKALLIMRNNTPRTGGHRMVDTVMQHGSLTLQLCQQPMWNAPRLLSIGKPLGLLGDIETN